MQGRNHCILGVLGLLACWSMPSAGVAAEQVIEDILVTATKRSEAISDIAGSISALGADAIEGRGINNIEDIQGMVPNLNFRDHLGSRLIAIRGIGGNIETGVVEPGVAVHLDGVYLPRGDILAVDFNDLERVEVLRGPQGTLYGKNATGGTVNFISKAPTDAFAGRVSMGGGSFGEWRASAMMSGPVGEGVGGRLSAFYSESDGFIDNIWTGNDIGGGEKFGVRGVLAFDVGDRWTANLSAYHQQSDLSGPVQVDFALPTAAFPALASAFFGVSVTNTDGWHEVAQFFDPETEIETTGGVLRIEGALTDSISLTSTTGYIDHRYGPQIYGFSGIVSNGLLTPNQDLQFGTIGRPDAPREQTSEAFSQELILTGASGGFEWLVGLYYFAEDFSAEIPFEFVDTNVKALVGGSFTQQDPIVFPPGTLFFGNNQSLLEKNRNLAGFVDVTWRLAEDWRLNLGGRYGSEDKKTTQFLETILILPPGAPLLPTGGNFILPICPPGNEVDLEENKFSPKARVEWSPADDHLSYLQYQEGVKSGQVNLSLCNDVVEPEEIVAYEFGYKAQFASGRGTFNAAAFFYDYEQYQSLEFTVDGTSAYLTNVPEAEILGAEVELAYAANESLALDFAFTWLDSEVTKGSVEIGTDTSNLAAGVQNLEGNPLPSTPEFTFQAGLEHYAIFGEASLTTRLEYAYFDEHSFRLFGVRKVHPEDGQKAYGLLNLYATLSLADGRYLVRGYLRNLTDEKYKYWSLYSLSTGFSGSAAPPLSWGLDLVANF